MKNRSPATEQLPATLLNDLHALVAEAEKMIADAAPDQTNDVLGDIRARFAAAQDRLGNLYADTRQKVAAGAKYTNETIRANPYQSIAIAAGIGLIAGVLVGRRTVSQG